MNFRTTVILIVLLVVVGAFLVWDRTNQKPEGEAQKTQATDEGGAKIADIDPASVTAVTITPAEGAATVLTKADGKWRMTQPMNAAADQFAVDDLVRNLTDLRSQGSVDASNAGPSKYVVQLGGAKSVKLSISAKSVVGNTMYVSADGGKPQVTASDIYDKLGKTDDLRDKQLVTASSTDIKQIAVEGEGTKYALAKTGSNWKVLQPQVMPAEESAASDIVYALTGMRAVGFVANVPASTTGLDKPVATISYSTAAPATQPSGAGSPSAASQPAMTTVALGRYEDIRKQNIYATVVGSNVIARVPATILDSIKKQPLDLRDKKVMDIEPGDVTELRLSIDKSATTQPATKPAVKKEVVLQLMQVRPLEPATAPATKATTGPATKPATKPTESKWLVREMGSNVAADDAKVNSLLGDLHPLRAEKYLEKAPTTRPVAQYALKVTSGGLHGLALVQYDLHITDPGGEKPVIGEMNGLSFEMSRGILAKFDESYMKDTTTPLPSSIERVQ
jgi:hypothetical protein